MEGLWTKSFILMSLGMLFLFIAFYMLYPTMPLFIIEIGGNEAQVGLATGTFMLAAVFLRPFIGSALDRFGRRQFIIWGLLLFIIFMYSYEWVTGIVFLLAIRVVHGMSWGITTTSMSTAITDMIPKTRRGEGLGWSGMAMTFAMAIGPLIGLWISENGSYQMLFLLASSLAFIALLLTFGAKMPYKPNADTKKIELFERSAIPISLAVFFLFIAYGGITTFVPLFAHSIQVNSGMFFLIYAGTLVLIRPFAGKLSDRKGETFVIIPSLAITIISLIVLCFASELTGVLISAVLYGIGFGSAQPAFQAAMLRLVSQDRIGVANATFSTAIDLGIGLGAMMLGWVSQFWNYQILFILSAIMVGCSFLLFCLFVMRSLKKENIVQPTLKSFSSSLK